MNEILRFLMTNCSFLFEENRFKFVDSEVGQSFGDAFLVLASSALRLRFVRDRGQLFLDFQSVHHRGERHWYSVDVVRQLVTGEKQRSAELDMDYVAFLENRLDEIEQVFSKPRLTKTVSALRKLEQTRAKELFGADPPILPRGRR